MKLYLILSFLLLSNYCLSAEKLKGHLEKSEFGGLHKILKSRYLRVLTTKNPYDYYIYQGRTKGIQYEMVKEFTKYLNRKYTKKNELRIVFEMVPVEFDQLIPMLNAGKGDIIAVGLTRTFQREKEINFTSPYRVVDEVIVTRKELAHKKWQGQTIHVPKDSSYYHSLRKHKKLVDVDTVDKNLHAGNLMELVSLKKYDYTLVNSFWAKTVGRGFKNLVTLKEKPFRKGIEISWGVKKLDSELLNELNNFMPKVKKGSLLGNIFSYKYFSDIARVKSKDFDLSKSQLSKYDQTIKKYAKMYDFDWRLVAALCYQESRFQQDIVNKWGAIGLFQIKQMTANEPYIAIPNVRGKDNYDNNIHAGIKYLSWIKKRYFDTKKDMAEKERFRMAMASYNAGPARVLRAIKKAKQMQLDPNKWFRNVELAMLKQGFPEPVVYVSEINKLYVSYLLLGIK